MFENKPKSKIKQNKKLFYKVRIYKECLANKQIINL